MTIFKIIIFYNFGMYQIGFTISKTTFVFKIPHILELRYELQQTHIVRL